MAPIWTIDFGSGGGTTRRRGRVELHDPVALARQYPRPPPCRGRGVLLQRQEPELRAVAVGDDQRAASETGASTAACGRPPGRILFAHAAARLVLAVKLPPSRSCMHLDTVLTTVNRDAVTLYPSVVNDDVQIRAHSPGRRAGRPPGRRALSRQVIDALSHALELDAIRGIPTGGDSAEMAREQWDDSTTWCA